MNPTADKLVDDYLDRLERELSDAPRDRRRELIAEIERHIAEARAELPSNGEADVRTLLERIGEPSDLAADARDRLGLASPVPERRAGFIEVAAVILLPIGGVLIPVVGWVAGVVLLWMSTAWSVRDKLIGTFVLPGGLLFPLFFGFHGIGGTFDESCISEIDPETGTTISQTCTGGTSAIEQGLVVGAYGIAVVLPIASAIYLAVRLRRG